MLDVSSPGRAEPKHKSIDVGANLLSSWLNDKSQLREQSSRLLVATVLTVVCGALVLPILWGIQTTAQGERSTLHAELQNLDLTLKKQTERQELLKPQVARSEMLRIAQKENDVFLGQILYVLNSTSERTVLNSFRAEIFGGEMTIRCDANAESNSDALEFRSRAERSPGTKNPLLTAVRPNAAMGKTGVTFEFTKKVEVSK